MFGQGILLPMV